MLQKCKEKEKNRYVPNPGRRCVDFGERGESKTLEQKENKKSSKETRRTKH